MFRLAQHKIFVVFSFPVNYGIKVISLCGDNSTEYGFHMVVTHSSAKSESMSDISEEIRKYFSELIKPLATNTSLKEMFDKMKEEVISKFESKISEQNDKIYELESRVAIQEQTINNLLTKCDDNKQYSRRSCLRIHGIESNSNEEMKM